MKNEIKVGILGVAALLILIFGYKFLKGQNLLEKSQTYYIRYDNVQQLAVSDGVFVNGFKVGSVIDMKIDEADANFIIVEININADFQLPKDVVAVLSPNGVLGNKLINLEFDKVCHSNCLENKSFIPSDDKGILSSMLGEPEDVQAYYDGIKSSIQDDERLQGSIKNIEEMVQHLNGVTARLDELLTASNRSLSNTFRNLDQVTGEVAQNKQSISTSLANLEEFSNQLKEAKIDELSKNINTTVTSADATFSKLTQTLDQTNQTLANLKGLVAGLNEGEGTLGQLLKDDALADKLEEATTNLNLLLQDFRLNPKRYVNVSVFGKKQKDYEVPENDPANPK